jgi:hypothetical protein
MAQADKLAPGHFSLKELSDADRFLLLPIGLPPEIRAIADVIEAWHLHHGGREELSRVIQITTALLGFQEERSPEFQQFPGQLF